MIVPESLKYPEILDISECERWKDDAFLWFYNGRVLLFPVLSLFRIRIDHEVSTEYSSQVMFLEILIAISGLNNNLALVNSSVYKSYLVKIGSPSFLVYHEQNCWATIAALILGIGICYTDLTSITVNIITFFRRTKKVTKWLCLSMCHVLVIEYRCVMCIHSLCFVRRLFFSLHQSTELGHVWQEKVTLFFVLVDILVLKWH